MNPKIYQLDEHTLDKQHCDPDALKVIQTLQQAGHVAYLVGGSVRDLRSKLAHLLLCPNRIDSRATHTPAGRTLAIEDI